MVGWKTVVALEICVNDCIEDIDYHSLVYAPLRSMLHRDMLIVVRYLLSVKRSLLETVIMCIASLSLTLLLDCPRRALIMFFAITCFKNIFGHFALLQKVCKLYNTSGFKPLQKNFS